jgi:hypothetical protein
MTPFESLIAEFAKNTGLPLEADAQESCSLETEDLVITLQYRRERDDVVLFAPVSEPGEELPPETLRAALELACNGKGTRGNYLGLFAGTLLLSRFMPFDGLTADALGESVLAFADAALAVRAALVEPAAEPVPVADADFPGEKGTGKFITV